jgi:hypothetical protein
MLHECLDVGGRRISKIRRHTFGISRIFESLMTQQIGANRHKNRSIQVKKARGVVIQHRRFIMPQVSVKDVAAYILEKMDSMTTMKLQKF